MQLETIAAAIGLAAVVLYAVFGGADFGGGVWDVFALGPRRIEQREAIGEAMSPVWETNHVWLIFLIVLLFTCFPPVFAKLGETLFVPVTIGLFGIVLRGAAFAFRGPSYRGIMPHKIWGVVFGIASIVTPFIFGATAASIATGRFDWLRPMPIAVGSFAVALCAQLAAVLLTAETTDNLRGDFRLRAYYATFVVALTGLIALLIGRATEPFLVAHLLSRPAIVIVAAAMLLGIILIVLLRVDQVSWARAAVGTEVAAILCGWYAAQAPYIFGQLGIAQPAAPQATLALFLWSAVAGAIVLVPSLALLFAVFKRTNSTQRSRR